MCCSAGAAAAGGATGGVPRLCVTNVQRFSLHDGGGIRSVAFTKGCPFCCPWCCNPENLSFEPEVCWHERLCLGCSVRADGRRDANGAPCDTSPERCPAAAKELLGQWRAVDELAAELLRDLPFYEESGGGVTVSGGECLAGVTRQRSVLALLELCHAGGASTALETTLATPLAVEPERLVAACDAFLVDFKVADRKRSLAVTGIDPAVRDANLARIIEAGGRVVARMPIIPGYTDDDACVLANVHRAASLGIRRADVLPFHQLGEGKYSSVGLDYEMSGVPPLAEADVGRIVSLVESAGLEVVVHGE